MKELTKQIKEKSFHKVYLLTGDEPYLVLQAKHMLKNAMIKEGDTMNYAAFTDGKIDLNTLQELAFTYPFFSEKRLLLLDGTGILKTGKDEFVSIMENMPETTCIIICEPEVDKRSKVYKWIKKNGYVGEFLKKNQTEKVLLRWIAALLGKEKKQIRENNARYFLQKTGDDMFQIKNEIDKLIAYAGDREEITQADIDAVASGEVQDKIFDFFKYASRSKIREENGLSEVSSKDYDFIPDFHPFLTSPRSQQVLSVPVTYCDDKTKQTARIEIMGWYIKDRQLKIRWKPKYMRKRRWRSSRISIDIVPDNYFFQGQIYRDSSAPIFLNNLSFDSKIPKSFLPHLKNQYQIFMALVEEQKRLALLRKVQLNNKD